MSALPSRILILALLFALLPACVTKGEHERLMALAAQRLQNHQQQAAKQQADAQAQIEQLTTKKNYLEAQLTDRDQQLAEARTHIANLQKKVDDAGALNQRLSEELAKVGKNVSKLLAEKGAINKSLSDTKKRLEELRKAQEKLKRRAALFKQLIHKFRKLIDAGDLQVIMRDGRMVLRLRTDVLFDSGRVDLKEDGKNALRDIAGVLMTLKDRKLQVAGHTDNVPISTNRFPSNWHLAAGRAISVVRFLVEEGVPPESLSAAGYGEFDPVATNDTEEDKAKNRRIEIVLQPDLSELGVFGPSS